MQTGSRQPFFIIDDPLNSDHLDVMAKAERVSQQDSKEIHKRHKQLKQRAKNLAGLKGADKNALLYERALLKQRLNEIDNHLIYEEKVKCSNPSCGIDYGETCWMGEDDIKDCGYFQRSFT